MQASKAFWNGITSATFIILNVWSKLQLVTWLERVLSQKLLLNACPEWLWGFLHFHHKETWHLEQREQSIHHSLTFCWCSWTGSPWDPGRPPQKAPRKQRLVSHEAFYTREINSTFPSAPCTITTNTLEGCNMGTCPIVSAPGSPPFSRISGLPRLEVALVSVPDCSQANATLCCSGASPHFWFPLQDSQIYKAARKGIKLQLSLLTLPSILVFTCSVLRCAQPELLSQPAPPALLWRPRQPLQHPSVQDIIVPCCVWASPLRTQRLPTVTLQTYVQMFPVSTIGNNGGFSGAELTGKWFNGAHYNWKS